MALNTKMVTTLILAIVVIIVVMQTLADTGDDVGASADNLTETYNSSGVCASGGVCGAETYPLTSFFKKKGVILLALLAGVAITLIVAVLPKGKK